MTVPDARQTDFSGVICAVVTPLGDDGRLDLDQFRALMEFQRAQSSGAFVLGTAGEGLWLGVDQWQAIAECALDYERPDFRVVLNCSAMGSDGTRELVSIAARLGAPRVACLPPLFYGSHSESTVRHFDAVRRAAPEMTLYLYNNPARVGYSVAPHVLARLISECGLSGVKDTGDSITRLLDYMALGLPIELYTGSNVLLLSALAVGANGGVSTLANVVPELFQRVHSGFRAGELPAARCAQLAIVRLQQYISDLSLVAATKHLLRARGLAGGSPKFPTPPLTHAEIDSLRVRIQNDADLSIYLADI